MFVITHFATKVRISIVEGPLYNPVSWEMHVHSIHQDTGGYVFIYLCRRIEASVVDHLIFLFSQR